ncbi:2-phosphosulfolactate phosphatase [Kitasatospora sp. NPDC006697]|uniref:2-phosphosulfolactate phosphatase n=1 Tax=Kitasatospora sp. NPDC006697 TaxID=3364020 RepID=UPI0036C6C60F
MPSYAQRFYSGRMTAFLLSQPVQPCMLCGTTGRIGALATCGHLLCPDCLDRRAADGVPDACPLCWQPYLRAKPYAPPERGGGRPAEEVRRAVHLLGDGTLRPLRLGGGPAEQTADARELLLRLLARTTPLNPQDRADLAVLLPHAPGAPADWLPARIPVRETKAAVLAALLRAEATRAAAVELLPAQLTTATDLLRLLWAWSGADADLLAPPPRLAAVPRPLRRALLARLDAFDPSLLREDLGRHRQAWLRVGELLHPGEHRARFGNAARAFDALRGDAAALPPGFAARVEQALAAGDPDAATALLLTRPGELVRRLHHLLRVQTERQDPAVLPAGLAEGLPGALRAVAPGPLLGAWGRLRGPREPGERRAYFPRGRITKVYGRDDWGAPVPAELADPVAGLIEAELLRRAAHGVPVETALLDEGLADLTVPFAERALSKALVAVPRGSVQPVPPAARVRLFVHWVQPAGVRVDLDLSVAFFGAGWEPMGQCDYTRLVWGDRAAVHSGDYTEAPAPAGATEFADLDLPRLAAAGVRYVLPVVFSYNDIPFEELPKAFAGFMALAPDDTSGGPYHPDAVRQRFDLAGDARACLPMVVDLAEGRAHWTDVNLSASGGLHNVDRHGRRLGLLASDLLAHFGGGSRATLWDLARWRAAGTAREVLVRSRDGASVRAYRRGDGESAGSFAGRIGGLDAPSTPLAPVTASPAFLALVHGDLPAPGATGQAYRLYPGALDESAGLTRLAAGDLLASFDVPGSAAVVIDVLRAFTVAAQAFAQGAERIVLADSLDQALALKARHPDWLAIKDGAPADGFDSVNSPGHLRALTLTGRTLIQKTTNGTVGAHASRDATLLLCASFVTAAATADLLRTRGLTPHFVITGDDGTAPEDRACADYITALLADPAASPAPYLTEAATAPHAATLAEGVRRGYPGIHPDDVPLCLTAEQYPFALVATEEAGLLTLRAVTGDHCPPAPGRRRTTC